MKIRLLTAVAVLSALGACGGSDSGQNKSTALLAGAVQAGVVADATAYHTVVQQLYIGYMGRPADTGGLANFSAALAAVGAPTDAPGLSQAYAGNETVRTLIDSFGTSEESRQLYGGDTRAFVTAVYMSLFNRSPDAEGLAFWSNAVDSGNLTKGNAALSILSGALENRSAQGAIDANSVRNKVAVGSNFTAALLTPANVKGYTGPAAAAAARALLAGVDGATDVAQYQGAVARAVARVSVSGASALANVQWHIAAQPQLALADAQGSPVSLDGMRCAAVDAAALDVAADCSSVRARRLGVHQITVMGSNAAATVPFTVIPQRQPFGTHGVTSDYNVLATGTGNALAWGINPGGVLGQGQASPALSGSSLPLAVKDSAGTGLLADIVSASAGVTGAMALTASGEVLGWGTGSYTGTTFLPAKIMDTAGTGGLRHIVQAGIGDANAAALADDGTVYSWGYHRGQGDQGANDLATRPAKVKNAAGTGDLDNIVSISVGYNFTLALGADGKVYSWGANASGQTGHGGTAASSLPATVKLAQDNTELGDVVAVSAGYNFALALTADGKVYAWGDNTYGQLGQLAGNGMYTRAVAVKDGNGGVLGNIRMVSAGGLHALALDQAGKVLSWGDGSAGSLGEGTAARTGSDAWKALPVSGIGGTGQLGGIVAVGTGYHHSLALAADGSVLIWGAGFGGNLGQGNGGNGGNADSATPRPVKNPDGNAPLQLPGMGAYLNPVMRGRW